MILCDRCGSDHEVTPIVDPFGHVQGHQCSACDERAWERHCTDYDALGAAERLELDHRKRETE